MIQHMVAFKWREGVSQSVIDGVIADIKGLSKIDKVTDFICGPNIGNGSETYNFALSMRLPSMEYLEQTYRPHPIHMRVLEGLGKTTDSRLVIDVAL
jgi:hypothetical protein